MMPEEEAKTKWCPQTRRIDDLDDTRDRCIGSACMAWRWSLSPERAEANKQPPHSAHTRTTTAHGYCGLAGKVNP